MLRKLVFTLIVLFIFFATVIGYASYNIWYQNNFKTLLQVVPHEGKKLDYLLFTDISGFGDRTWYVYELSAKSKMTDDIKRAHNKNGVIFWNYSEAGNQTEDPKIEILDNRYLVFSRGHYYHSLYDIENKKLLFNYISPWGSYVLSPEFRKLPDNTTYDEEIRLMDLWVEKNIHQRIKNIASID